MLGIYELNGTVTRLLRPCRQATPHRFGFQPWEWLHPPGLVTAEEKLSQKGPCFRLHLQI